MEVSLVTTQDLVDFKSELYQLLQTVKEEIIDSKPQPDKETVWLKSHQVERLLGISTGTLQNLRVNGTIPYSKIGGIIFYDKEEIKKVMEDNKRNPL
jgi:predicted DNA-binding transcriptional regulator AlpA